MTVAVGAYTDHTILSTGCTQERGRAGILTAVVRHLQNVAAEIDACIAYKLAFDR